jgi:hypothetical protein
MFKAAADRANADASGQLILINKIGKQLSSLVISSTVYIQFKAQHNREKDLYL